MHVCVRASQRTWEKEAGNNAETLTRTKTAGRAGLPVDAVN
jgi:hypothetical protein